MSGPDVHLSTRPDSPGDPELCTEPELRREQDPPKDAGRRARALRELLVAPSPAAVLQRIADGDPLGLGPLAQRRLLERALLLDPGRVHLRALAMCALGAGDFRGQVGLARWLVERVDEAIDGLLSTGCPASSRRLSLLLGLEPADARRALAGFHAAPREQRAVFLELFVVGHSLDSVAHSRRTDLCSVARLAREALCNLLGGEPGDAPGVSA